MSAGMIVNLAIMQPANGSMWTIFTTRSLANAMNASDGWHGCPPSQPSRAPPISIVPIPNDDGTPPRWHHFKSPKHIKHITKAAHSLPIHTPGFETRVVDEYAVPFHLVALAAKERTSGWIMAPMEPIERGDTARYEAIPALPFDEGVPLQMLSTSSSLPRKIVPLHSPRRDVGRKRVEGLWEWREDENPDVELEAGEFKKDMARVHIRPWPSTQMYKGSLATRAFLDFGSPHSCHHPYHPRTSHP
ncbi:hypothetical protein FIBSPDRAFT_938945, partial [Athelia psychrophila]